MGVVTVYLFVRTHECKLGFSKVLYGPLKKLRKLKSNLCVDLDQKMHHNQGRRHNSDIGVANFFFKSV